MREGKIKYCFTLIALTGYFFFSCSKPLVNTNEKVELRTEQKNMNEYSYLNDREFSKNELTSFVDNREGFFIYSKKIEKYNYLLQFKPVDYIIATENEGDTLSSKFLNDQRKELDGLDYFTFKMKVDGFNGELLRYDLKEGQDYYERLNYLMSGMEKDIYLISGTDSLNCLLYHFERTFGASPFITVSLGFERSTQLQSDKIFVLNDNLFNNGKVKIALPKEIFNKQPKLKYL